MSFNDRGNLSFTCCLMILTITLTGCSLANGDQTSEVLLAPTPTITANTVSTITPELPQINTPTRDFESAYLPDIALNLGTDDWRQCERDGTNQIWISSPPFKSAEALLVDESIDYNFPENSPDGEWIAYVYSDPKVIDVEQQDDALSGTDSIWIIRADGSERRKVSEALPRTNIISPGGCLVATYITKNLVWSYDGRYLAFSYKDMKDLLTTYFIVDVESGKTKELLTQALDNSPVWIPDSSELAIIGDVITIFSIKSIKEIESKTITYPSEIPEDAILGLEHDEKYQIQAVDHLLISSFNELENVKPIFISLWQVNIDSGEWDALLNQPNEYWGNPIIGRDKAVACGLDWNLYLLNPNTWSVIDIYENPHGIKTCRLLDILQNKSGQDIASFLGYVRTGESDESPILSGVFTTELDSDQLDPQLLFTTNSLGISPLYTAVIDYSWRNRSE